MFVDVSGDGGVLKETTKDGNGVAPKQGQVVFAHYTGTLESGQVFDSSRSKPYRAKYGFYFPLGGGAVIKGWDVGFASMSIGECAKLKLRGDYAYGARGSPGSGIPPNATLIFDVELLDARTMTEAEMDAVDAEVNAMRGK